ncbi:MAG: polyketide cyclase [Candidatus Taylorbacteria bacterium]|nr:polyketide cyclase [Candidatus Taylorbacteria bacterium]
MKQQITVTTFVNAPTEKVWRCWTQPEHIMKWYQASPDWHAPAAINDVRVGGRFMTRMAAKDGSAGFDFTGTYTEIEKHRKIEYKTDDDRKVSVVFARKENPAKPGEEGCEVTETFEAESINSIEMQRGGWQAILESFKQYVEAQK